MNLSLGNFEESSKNAVRLFWQSRQESAANQILLGKSDQGNRAAVTAGKNMNGFVNMVCEVIKANGMPESSIHLQKRLLTLPGFFRPTKSWDLLVIFKGKLIAALEFKSQVGSLGNNFNNRAEEAIGTALDLQTVFREGGFGDQVKPFVGWVILLEDCPQSRRPVNDRSPHFPLFPEFVGASYANRYHLLCKKLMQEKLYDSAAFLLASKENALSGDFTELDQMTSLRTFMSQLAGRVAAEAAGP